MGESDVDVLLLSHGADLPWLTGYRAMPLERLTMLVLPVVGEPVLVVPAWRRPGCPAPRTCSHSCRGRTTEDPVDLVGRRSVAGRGRAVGRVGSGAGPPPCSPSSVGCPRRDGSRRRRSPRRSARSRTTPRWPPCGPPARPPTGWPPCCRPVRSRWSGGPRRRCRPTSASLLIAEGHSEVNFAIVGSGPNAASPHHEPGQRVIGPDETVVCDFGGTLRSTATSATARTSPAPW